MINFYLRRQVVANGRMVYKGMVSTIYLTSLERLSMPLLYGLAVGTVFMLIKLRLRWVRRVLQGEDVFGLDLGRAVKPH